MRPVLSRAAVAAACLSALVLAGCGKHVASNAPVTWAPADTPYLFANTQAIPEAATQAWGNAGEAFIPSDIQQLGQMAQAVAPKDPVLAKILDALGAELASVKTRKDLTQTTGFSQFQLFAVYGVGDVPVARINLVSPDAFKAFWTRVEKRAGVSAPTASVDNQGYWKLGGPDAKVHVLVAVEQNQLVVTFAPDNASPELLKQLLGLAKPASNAAGRLARINGAHGYSDYGSGYVDFPKLFANLFDGKDAVTQAFAKDLGTDIANPTCATEFASLAGQVPLLSAGLDDYTAKKVRASVDVQLSPALLGALTALRQPVPGMAAKSDDSMFDLVLALPLEKWQAFLKGRAEAAAHKTYQCPALASLNKFARTAANPPVQMPPQAASLEGFRLMLDKWDIGPQIAGRLLVASSDPANLTREIQQTLPQFALKSIPMDGKPVAFDLPPRVAAMLGSGNQGWIAADKAALVVGAGNGEDARLGDALNAPAGNGDALLRMHFDGRMYPLLGSWLQRFAGMLPTDKQARLQQQIAAFDAMGKVVQAGDLQVTLDAKGLHLETVTQHK